MSLHTPTLFKKKGSLTLFLIPLCFLPVTASAELKNAVTWEELPAHMEGKPVTELTFSLEKCPLTLDKNKHDRLTIQWIENTYYKWREYDLTENTRCVIMDKPYSLILSAPSAETLLNASQLWQNTISTQVSENAIILDQNDPSLRLEPVPVPILSDGNSTDESDHKESRIIVPAKHPPKNRKSNGAKKDEARVQYSVIGDDDRVVVGNTQSFPFNTLVFASFSQNGSGYRATGFLVSPYAALTNGHVVYDQGSSSWSTGMNIYPAQYVNASSVVRPYGGRAASFLSTNTDYTSGSSDARYDYGAIKFDEPFSEITTYMPLQFGFDMDSNSITLNNAGYPGAAQGSSTNALWYDNDLSSTDTSTYVARYFMDTSGGNSGGPVWIYNGTDRAVVAIHCCGWGGTAPNGGPRLGSNNQSLIEGWVSWAPDATGDVYEPDNTYSDAGSIPYGGLQTHSLLPSGDVDWIQFSLTATGSTEVIVDLESTDTGADFNLEIYSDPQAAPIGAFRNTGNSSTNSASLTAGSYFIAVYDANQRVVNDYVVSVRLGTTSVQDSHEPDNDAQTAKTIAPDQPHSHSIVPAGDVDWVKFSLSEYSDITIETINPSGDHHDTVIELFNSNTVSLTSDDDSGVGFLSKIETTLAPGDYYLRTQEYDNSRIIEGYDILLSIDGSHYTGDDFFFSYIQNPATVNSGQSFNVQTNLNYRGDSTTMLNPQVGFYLSENPEFNSSAQLLNTVTTSLRADRTSDSANAQLLIPYTFGGGTYYLHFVADYNQQYPEFDETNNIQSTAIQVLSSGSGGGDVNDDGRINVADMVIVIGRVLSGSSDLSADCDMNGQINEQDIDCVLNAALSPSPVN